MKGSLLYEGKAKQVYRVEGEAEQLILSYKNDATAFNGKKKDQFNGKGRLNNLISANVFAYLHQHDVRSHFIKTLNDTEQLVEKTTIIPLEVVVRNVAAGSIVKRLGLEEKQPFDSPLIELFYKNDDLNDPLINDEHAYLLADVTEEELNVLKRMTLTVNTQLRSLFADVNLQLVDFKLEFGRRQDGSLVLSDEISPDTCRLWDRETGEKMDKDVFRQGLGDLVDVYEVILQRLEEKAHA
ncbi:phosphoribosylaminoimidazolesuccinocarboxamide synthase [Thalassobacillus sp. CUG 92003]|uniref:phosphoribosylaminoimidazolesuccinocarboxamide synthase n=1 Tax=Thalassobacillus sp. CUG 92003 TaxID=2736641 RepID=UPI00272B96A6|nr:phosphoribosylaminoimidazolesuccinocarboxamide synthase [Thalassobacillus sp. CUG 92003]